MAVPPATNVPDYSIERRIHMMRGQKVMLDSDLAELYGVQTKRLNEAVKRNAERFPATFMFQLTDAEAATISSRRKIKYQPLAFTEHGVVMRRPRKTCRRRFQNNESSVERASLDMGMVTITDVPEPFDSIFNSP